MGPVLNAVTGWLLYIALVAATGGLAARWLLLPRLTDLATPATDWLNDAAGRLGLLGASLLPLALALVFVRQLLDFRDPFVAWTEDAELLLTGTAWGATWLWGAAGSIVAAISFVFAVRGARVGWWIGTLAVLGLGSFPALTGHASGTESLRAITLTADTLHVWAAGAWAGGLGFVLYTERGWQTRGGPDAGSLLPILVPAFSPLAVACVATLVVTGALAAWVHVGSLGALVSASYGRLLAFKLLLVSVVLGLGFLNWRRLTPRLGEASGQRALGRAATAELLVVQAVLLVTAILVRTPPPTH